MIRGFCKKKDLERYKKVKCPVLIGPLCEIGGVPLVVIEAEKFEEIKATLREIHLDDWREVEKLKDALKLMEEE